MRLRRKGVFFVSVLLLTVLVAMFVGASAELGTWGLRSTVNGADLAAAHRAARSGVAYAAARLKDNPNWKASGPRTTVVNQPYLTVVEENGNVVGLMRSDGQVSQFRIRFNFQDGPGGGDGLPDVTDDMDLSSLTQVSFNNLALTSEATVPTVISGSANAAIPYTTIPGSSVQLYVEGRCGSGLEGATVASPNPTGSGLAVASSAIETCYKVMNPINGGPASVAAGAGSMKLAVGNGKKDAVSLDSADNVVVGRLRTRDTLDVQGGYSGDPNLTAGKAGEYRALNGKTSGTVVDPKVKSATEASADGLPSLTWAQVRQATTNSLPAGTYVFWDDGTLHYFDKTSSEYRTYMSNPANYADPGTVITQADLPASLKLSVSKTGTKTDAKLQVIGDTLVQPSATNKKELALLPRKSAAAGPGAPPAGGTTITTSGGLWSAIAGADASMLTKTDATHWVVHGTLADLVSAAVQDQWGATSSYNLAGLQMNNLGTSSVNLDDLNLPALAALGGGLWNYYSTNGAAAAVTNFNGAATGGEDLSTDIAGVPDVLNPRNITLEFKPSGGTSAVLTVPGRTTIGAQLKGQGGSITTEGDLNLVGLGVDFAALSNPTEGVSLYSKKNILISSYDQNTNKYHDVKFKGVVYCWGDFLGLLGHSTITNTKDWGKFSLTGSLVAYGKDPSDMAAAATKGKIEITAEDTNLKYDPSYTGTLTGSLPPIVVLGRVRWMQL